MSKITAPEPEPTEKKTRKRAKVTVVVADGEKKSPAKASARGSSRAASRSTLKSSGKAPSSRKSLTAANAAPASRGKMIDFAPRKAKRASTTSAALSKKAQTKMNTPSRPVRTTDGIIRTPRVTKKTVMPEAVREEVVLIDGVESLNDYLPLPQNANTEAPAEAPEAEDPAEAIMKELAYIEEMPETEEYTEEVVEEYTVETTETVEDVPEELFNGGFSEELPEEPAAEDNRASRMSFAENIIRDEFGDEIAEEFTDDGPLAEFSKLDELEEEPDEMETLRSAAEEFTADEVNPEEFAAALAAKKQEEEELHKRNMEQRIAWDSGKNPFLTSVQVEKRPLSGTMKAAASDSEEEVAEEEQEESGGLGALLIENDEDLVGTAAAPVVSRTSTNASAAASRERDRGGFFSTGAGMAVIIGATVLLGGGVGALVYLIFFR